MHFDKVFLSILSFRNTKYMLNNLVFPNKKTVKISSSSKITKS